MALVKQEIRDGIGILTLDHPEKRNALGERMVEEILGRLTELQVMKVPAVILRAAEGGAAKLTLITLGAPLKF